MRVEATVSDVRGQQLADIAQELGISKSQLVDEAVTLYLVALSEARQGRRVAVVEPSTQKPIKELLTPSLSQLDWAAQREQVVLSKEEFDRVVQLIEKPPEKPAKLKKLMTATPREKLAAVLAAHRRSR